MTAPGKFIISLDMELHWGVRDHASVASYRENLLGERQAIPAILERFERQQIHATWATVGMLFAESRDELIRSFPTVLPAYTDARLSPYGLDDVGEDEASDPFHFAPSLIAWIARTPHQEIASHTFSHYYCLEPGQTAEAFEADLLAARAIGAKFGDVLQSLVYPRNQHNEAYRAVLSKLGVKAIRTNGPGRPYAARANRDERLVHRAGRLLDSYVPWTGSRTYARPPTGEGPIEVPASLFLRPFEPRLRWLQPLRVQRIMRAMEDAAQHGRLFHLWWHPHNFGTHLPENLRLLDEVLDAYARLRERYGMRSVSMAEHAAECSHD